MADEVKPVVSASRESCVVQSKVRDYIRSKDMRVSEDFITALSESVYAELDKAIHRCKENGRSTLRSCDL